MSATPTSNSVREIVARAFLELAAGAGDGSLVETILISEGKYRGRSYRGSGMLAMWLVDSGVLQIYDGLGQMRRTIDLAAPQAPAANAA